MRYGSATDAPTHLSTHAALPPEWRPDDREIVTSAPRSGLPRAVIQPPTHLSMAHRPAPRVPEVSRNDPRVPIERSVAPVRVPTERSVSRGSGPFSRPSYDDEPAPLPQAPRRGSSKSIASRSVSRSAGKSAAAHDDGRGRGSNRNINKSAHGTPPTGTQAPRASTPDVQPAPEAPQMPAGINAIDPLAVPVPPELGSTIYGWVRRLALQADLQGADRLLRDALLDVTSSLSVSIVYPGQDGMWTLGADEEIPRDAQPLIAVAMARRAILSSHSAIIPVITTSETVAVITLQRNPRNPAYHPIEQIAMVALAREAASVMHHLAVAHLQKTNEINADKGGLYRGEALEAHRSRGQEGVPINLTPGWVRRTYPFLVLCVLVALVVSVFITVPTYSSGQGMVWNPGTSITSPAVGTVDQIYVQQGDFVKQGQILCRLHSAEQEAELAMARTELENVKVSYLQDPNDEQIRKAVASATARVENARAKLDSRLIRARKDGVVADRNIRIGQPLNIGDHVLSIVDPDSQPEMIAFLPGTDRPRLKVGQELQIGLTGYKKVREIAIITSISNEVIGVQEIARHVGPQQADQFKNLAGGSFVIVKAKLPSRTFSTEHRTYHYFHGMHATTEVKVMSKPFLVSLLPALEKYFPD